MLARAMDGTCLAELVRMAIPIFRAAQSQCPRAGPGRRPDFDDWKMAVLIMVAILKKRKSKSAQYRFLWEHRLPLHRWLELDRFPARSTYFERYPQARRLLAPGIRRQGAQAIREGLTTARSVAVDKSLLSARGRAGPGKRRKAKRPQPPGVDRQADWGFSPYHGWVYGYSYEVLTTADEGTVHLPWVASVDVASTSEYVTAGQKFKSLPPTTRFVLADGGYDSNALGEAVEWDEEGHRTGRRFLCPRNRRTGRGRPTSWRTSRKERQVQRRRWERIDFYEGPRGRKLYAQRGQSVEPLHERLKSLFEVNPHVWHRGLANNQTQLLAMIFCYQLLLRYNHACGRRDAKVQWILESL